MSEPLIIVLGFVSIIVIVAMIHALRSTPKPFEETTPEPEVIKPSVSVVDIPFHPDDLIKSKSYLSQETAEKPNIEYYPSLSRTDILELKKLGVDARRATKKWVKGKSLDHLPKEKVFKMLRDSYWWESYWKDKPLDFLIFKGMEWVFKGDLSES